MIDTLQTLDKFNKNEFIIQMLGTNDITAVIVGFTFAIIGILLSMLLHYRVSGKHNKNTPDKFDFNYMFWDNIGRILSTLIVVLLVMRFSTEFLGHETTEFWAMIYGLCSDKLVEIFKKIMDGYSPKEAAFSLFKKQDETPL